MNKNMGEKVIICIGRQMGSGGKEVAELLGKRLGVQVFDQELLAEAARESGLSSELFEKADEKALRKSGYMGGNIFSSGFHSGFLSNDSLFKVQSDVIRLIAEKQSAIFVGRCADYILRDFEECYSVFISADRADRIARIASRRSLSEREAETCIDQTDRKRSSYYGYYSFKTWGAAESYDLCINSSRLGTEATADAIISFIENCRK